MLRVKNSFRRGIMQRSHTGVWVAVAVFVGFASGCVAPQRMVPQDTVAKLHTIAVVSIEAPPLLVHTSNEVEHATVSAVGLIPPGPGGSMGIGYIPLPIYCPLCPIVQLSLYFAVSSAPRTGERVVVTRDPPPPWMLTSGLSESAVRHLGRAGTREAFIMHGYGQLPVKDRSVNNFLENWMAPIRRWYNAEESPLDYAVAGTPHADAILEVGVSNYEYALGDHLFLQVMVKLIDPVTKRVIANTRNAAHPQGLPLAKMLSDQAGPLRRLVETTGESLLVQCLLDLGLVPR